MHYIGVETRPNAKHIIHHMDAMYAKNKNGAIEHIYSFELSDSEFRTLGKPLADSLMTFMRENPDRIFCSDKTLTAKRRRRDVSKLHNAVNGFVSKTETIMKREFERVFPSKSKSSVWETNYYSLMRKKAGDTVQFAHTDTKCQRTLIMLANMGPNTSYIRMYCCGLVLGDDDPRCPVDGEYVLVKIPPMYAITFLGTAIHAGKLSKDCVLVFRALSDVDPYDEYDFGYTFNPLSLVRFLNFGVLNDFICCILGTEMCTDITTDQTDWRLIAQTADSISSKHLKKYISEMMSKKITSCVVLDRFTIFYFCLWLGSTTKSLLFF